MIVLIVEKVSGSLKGEITRWMIELKAGVFVGSLSGMVRDKLWENVCKKAKEGNCILVYKFNNEQGFEIRTWGTGSREVVDLEGLFLTRMPNEE